MKNCRTSTSWVPDSLADIANFARMNSLPDMAMQIDHAINAYFAEERRIKDRGANGISVAAWLAEEGV